MWNIYIARCKDGSLYTGISTNVTERIKKHNKAKGARYTRTRRPVELVYTEEADSKVGAIKREIAIKNFTRKNKIKLIKFGLGKRYPSAGKAKLMQPRD